jgi:hypothetical protein
MIKANEGIFICDFISYFSIAEIYLFVVYLMMLSVAQTIALDDRMINELVMICKKWS